MKTKRYITFLLALCLVITVLSGGIAKAEGASVIKGDINADGKINNFDASFVLRYDAGLTQLTEAELLAGDCNGDGLTGNIDTACILRYGRAIC